MKTYLHKTPELIKLLYPNWVWDFNASGNELAITFDDGPHPIATPFVLEQLEKYGAKGTFFCVGANLKKYPDLVKDIISAGHAIGNHTFRHVNGRNTDLANYMREVSDCDRLINDFIDKDSLKIFRPPYGRLRYNQSRSLRPKYKIIMWDTLSGDFDVSLSEKRCLQQTINNINRGSIVLFHDSQKAFGKLKNVLPNYLETLCGRGYQSVSLTKDILT